LTVLPHLEGELVINLFKRWGAVSKAILVLTSACLATLITSPVAEAAGEISSVLPGCDPGACNDPQPPPTLLGIACAAAGYSTTPMAPEPVTANEDEPGVITVTVTRPTCSGDAPSAWFYVFDNYGGGHQYHIVDNGQAEQACQIPLLHAFQPGDLDDVVHAYAVNRNGHSSATADSNPFVFTGPVAGTSAPITNPCIG